MLYWWPMLLGWPAILAALVLSVAGILRHKPAWLFVSAIMVLPITLYLAANPLPGWPVLIVPLALAGAGIAIRRRYTRAAWFLLGPFVGISGWLAVAVMSQ
jgi:hypothetical protein